MTVQDFYILAFFVSFSTPNCLSERPLPTQHLFATYSHHQYVAQLHAFSRCPKRFFTPLSFAAEPLVLIPAGPKDLGKPPKLRREWSPTIEPFERPNTTNGLLFASKDNSGSRDQPSGDLCVGRRVSPTDHEKSHSRREESRTERNSKTAIFCAPGV